MERRERRRYRLPRTARLRHESDIRRLFRRGKRKRTGHLDVFVSASPVLRVRIGVVVPKHGHAVVERNRLKRQLREAARLELLPACREVGVPVDVLIRARPSAYGAGFHRLKEEIANISAELCSPGS